MHRNPYRDLKRSFSEIQDPPKTICNQVLSRVSFRQVYFKLSLKYA